MQFSITKKSSTLQALLEMLKQVNQSLLEISKPRFSDVRPNDLSEGRSSVMLESDEFRMYAFKIKRCSKTRSHDWMECPYAHRGEKARRRDPRKFNYNGIACAEFRRGTCHKGESCEFAHGVFEFWLHPARYRTRACKSGKYCQRKVCFFAHTSEQLRAGDKCACEFVDRTQLDGSDGGDGIGSVSPQLSPGNEFSSAGDWDILDGMRGMKIDDGDEFGGDISDSPDIHWIWELVED
ncbi:zinc finger C-x8-C-x5-C-x3-H type family protein [Tasmannia lanceolata]|uniref:zinc finger C-x8-C-x5-C-x3-H type family protein n=1 Tax=Tasmannia lanceolata TaxID=3420 RepID=UPI0040649B2A